MKRRSTSSSKTPPGQRQLRVGERIRHIIAATLQQGHWSDPALENASLISVTAVDIGPDLKNAIAYIMPLGGRDAEPIAQALNRAAGYFRSALAPELGLRHTPKVSFKVDNSFDNALHIETLLNQDRVRRDVENETAEDDAEEDEDFDEEEYDEEDGDEDDFDDEDDDAEDDAEEFFNELENQKE